MLTTFMQLVCRHFETTRSPGQAKDMVKDISKFLHHCDSSDIAVDNLEKYDEVVTYLESLVERGLGISSLVNKLTTFICALKWHLGDRPSPTLDRLTAYRAAKSTQKRLTLKRGADARLVQFT